MDLFTPEHEKNKNWLPKDGTAHYIPGFFQIKKAEHYFNRLLENIEWENDEIILFGKKIITKRKVAWYGDEAFSYTYSKNTKFAKPWTSELSEIKNKIEKECGESFNSCLLNLYHNGEEGMSWHTDNEKELKKQGTIASLSLGAERKFQFKHKSGKEKTELLLEQGSLLLMKGETQEFWLHKLPPTKRISQPRINLTFRTITSPYSESSRDYKKK
jgi:alkylated DNA repair dioxygenase AlkB